MKNTFIRAVAIFAAFFMGLSINNSCGKAEAAEVKETSLSSLQTEIDALRSELNTLKAQVGASTGGASLQAEVNTLKSDVGTLNQMWVPLNPT